MAERPYTDGEMDAALQALSDPARFREAERRVSRVAPQLQQILGQALRDGGWEGEVLEETRVGMLMGVAVGWELARELELKPTKGD